MEIFAHRGFSSKYPENTLIAFKKALEYPIDGIELDVHETKDGQVIVIHDETVDRTTSGSGNVRNMTLKEIQELDAGSYISPLFSGERIPLLEEVLELIGDRQIKINIELKTDVNPYYGMELKVLALIKKYKIESNVLISSFDHETLLRFKALAPEIEIAPLFSNIIVNPWEYTQQLGAEYMHISGYNMMRPSAIEAKKKGAKIRVYTINLQEHMNMLKSANVEGIFTDDVAAAIEWKRTK